MTASLRELHTFQIIIQLFFDKNAGHMRPERPPHLHPDMMHPALKEKGRVLPPRTIERQAKVNIFVCFF